MRIPAILTCLLAVFLAAMPVRRAHAAEEVSFDVFYNDLADDGDWYNTPEYGYVWQPSIAYKNDKWRPYTDGYWAQTDDGWTWVSYENFGWATYHYGRWTRLKDVGWAWVPGYDWGPGWVSWRTSDDYVGWAPLPPKADQGVYEGRVADRPPAESIDYNDVEPEQYGADTDVQYDIGPQNYCFVDTHNFGAPVLGEVCLPPERNFVIIENTVNVTNIYRRRGPDNFVVYNRGPDFNFISAHSERPIQQLRIERHDDIGFLRNGIRGGGNANQVRNGVFSVAAPSIARAPINFAQVKPVKVKQTLDRPEVVHGWSRPGGDPAATQRLRDQFKQQAQQAPPPRRDTAALPPRGNEPAHAAGNVPPAASGFAPQPFQQSPNAAPRQPLTDAEKTARRDAAQRAADARQKTPSAAPAAPAQAAPDRARGAGSNVQPVGPESKTPVASGQGLTPDERKARRQQEKAQPQPQQQPQAAGGAQPFEAQRPQAGNPAADDADKAARRAQRQQEKAQPSQQQQTQEAPTVKPSNPERDARRAEREPEKAQPQAQPAQQPAPDADREARRAQHQQEQAAPQRAPQPQAEAPNPEREARRAQRQQEQAAPPQRAPQPQAAQDQPSKGDAKGDDDKKKRKDQ